MHLRPDGVVGRAIARVALGCLTVTMVPSGCDRAQPPGPRVKDAEADKSSVSTPAPVPVPGPEADREIHGKVRMVDGQRLVNLWGTPQQRGYAHGYLLRAQVLDVVDGYVLEALDPKLFTNLGGVYDASAQIDAGLRQEAAAMIAGMKAAGGAQVAKLGRELTAVDILLMNAMTDLVAVGCSSVSAWGEATAADPELAGALAVVRNLDWAANPALLRSQVVMVYEPDDAEQQPVVSVAFAGYLGCLSCMNRAGVTSLFNMGYGEGVGSRTRLAMGFAPANLLLRQAMQARDIDGDGKSTAADIVEALEAGKHAGSYLVHVLEPPKQAASRGAPPAHVVEVEAEGVAVRAPEESSKLGGHVLAATNHLRKRQAAKPGRRYREIERTVSKARQAVDQPGLWSLGERVQISADVVHTLMFVPEKGEVRVKLR
ncbi:MAG: C45 family autoproteolytic acyltransferase/hydrolase, partial [Nannocystaceae bacterium]